MPEFQWQQEQQWLRDVARSVDDVPMPAHALGWVNQAADRWRLDGVVSMITR